MFRVRPEEIAEVVVYAVITKQDHPNDPARIISWDEGFFHSGNEEVHVVVRGILLKHPRVFFVKVNDEPEKRRRLRKRDVAFSQIIHEIAEEEAHARGIATK